MWCRERTLTIGISPGELADLLADRRDLDRLREQADVRRCGRRLWLGDTSYMAYGRQMTGGAKVIVWLTGTAWLVPRLPESLNSRPSLLPNKGERDKIGEAWRRCGQLSQALEGTAAADHRDQS